MQYSIQFQYKGPTMERPSDEAQNDSAIESEKGAYIPIPDVGDSVAFESNGKMKAFKVLTRHFTYYPKLDLCAINIVVTDISSEEMAAREKN